MRRLGNMMINLGVLLIMAGMLCVVAVCYTIAAVLAIPVWLLVILFRGWQDVLA